jgi:8-oxo-dGTP pyrophosphatase MutT (NUDIX family)
MFWSKTVEQVAALPFIIREGEIEVLLVTSRRRGRWVLPKGWPHPGHTHCDSAGREAEEESGAQGVAFPDPIGIYRYNKLIPKGYEVGCSVFVYPLLVTSQLLDWPEKHSRAAAWFPLAEAAANVNDPELGRLLADLAQTTPPPLRLIVEESPFA